MNTRRETFRAFSGMSLSNALNETLRIARGDIERESPEKFLSIPEADYVSHVLHRFRAQPFIVDFNNFEIKPESRQVRGTEFPVTWNVEPTQYYSRPGYVVLLPFEGEPDVLKYEPSVLHMWQPELFIEDNSIGFQILTFEDGVEPTKRIKNHYFYMLEQQLVNVNRDINDYNLRLEQTVINAVRQKRELFRQQEEVAAQLGGRRRPTLTSETSGETTERPEAASVADETITKASTTENDGSTLNEMLTDEELTRVFITYTHESEEHTNRVWDLASRLTEDGLECHLDADIAGTPEEGWYRWMMNQVRLADFVLVVCTPTYARRMLGTEEPGKGKGANWEAQLILSELYRNEGKNLKFIPVAFSDEDRNFIPDILSSATSYNLAHDASYEMLYRHLTRQPKRSLPQRGKIRRLHTEVGRTRPGRSE